MDNEKAAEVSALTMSWSVVMRFSSRVLVMILMVVPACGVVDAIDSEGEPCGALRCGVGEYCLDQEFGTCAPGCRADDYCPLWERCELPEGEVVGECVVSGLPTEPTTADSAVTACVEACDAYGFFGCPGAEVVECGERCGEVSEEDAAQFASCADATFCNYEECRDLLR